MDRRTFLTTTATLAIASRVAGAQSPRALSLDSPSGLRLHNVTAVPSTHAGRRGLRVRSTEAAQRREPSEYLAVVEGVEFGDGTIDVEVAGLPRTDVFADARGFVGVAFRVQPDLGTYDAFYVRPTNGRADDQVRRNHSAQYISHPDWPWQRLRKEFPEKYESYVDLEPGAWTRLRVEVRGTQARLFVHGQAQPTLIVQDLKTGAAGRGAVALWIADSTDAHFRDLTITTARTQATLPAAGRNV